MKWLFWIPATFLCLHFAAPHARAQAAAAGAAGAASGAAAPATGLTAFCQYIDSKIQACKAKICACPCGQMLTNGQAVGNLFLGGMCCPPCCPTVNPEDLKKASNTPEGACARFKQDMETMPARRKAIRCLAYADCHWWPEAEAALITALRTDRNECVRLEAAKVLGTGCCCTRKTLEALVIVVSASNRDGNPSENSPRVKAAALVALHHCVDCYVEPLPEPVRPEKAPLPKPDAGGSTVEKTDTPTSSSRESMADLVADARRLLNQAKISPVDHQPLQAGHQSLLEIYHVTANPGSFATPLASAKPPAAASPEPPGIAPVPSLGDVGSALPPTGRRSLFEIWQEAFRTHPQPPAQSNQ